MNEQELPPKATQSTPTPEGIIRKNNRRPFKRSTLNELADKTEQVRKWLILRLSKHEIHRKFERKYKQHWNACDIHIQRARALLVDLHKKPIEMAKDDAVAYYESVIASNKSSEMAKMRAQENLDKIYGAASALKVNIGDPDGNPIPGVIVAPTVTFVLPAKTQIEDAIETQIEDKNDAHQL